MASNGSGWRAHVPLATLLITLLGFGWGAATFIGVSAKRVEILEAHLSQQRATDAEQTRQLEELRADLQYLKGRGDAAVAALRELERERGRR